MYNIKQHNIWKLCTFVTDWQNWQSSISHLHKINFFQWSRFVILQHSLIIPSTDSSPCMPPPESPHNRHHIRQIIFVYGMFVVHVY